MAETLVSPGVLARENDSSFISQQPVTVGAALIGPTLKGPVEVPTIVTSYSDFINRFGAVVESGSETYTYFTSIAAYNYFINGGETLLVSRVKSGSFTYANSTDVATPDFASSFTLQTLSEGVIMNSAGSEDVYGALDNGTVNNIRWEIVNASVADGTFDLLIRQGNDTTNNKIVLETWTNLSLDPLAENYISKVIGDAVVAFNENLSNPQVTVNGDYDNASRYVRVSAILHPTPNYFDNSGSPVAAYAGYIPNNQTGTFEGAAGSVMAGANFYNNISGTNTQGLVGTDYDGMISLMANQDDYRFNILLTPGLYNSAYTAQCTQLINNTQGRGDNLLVLDLVPYNSTVTSVTGQASTRNSSYVSSYWPWVRVMDPDLGKQVWVPASTVMAGVFAYNDSVSEPWFAPAGINRGGLGQVIRAEQRLSQTQRDTLYSGKVNPIATFPGQGVVVYGQKTLQTRASALDRVNVRRLLITLKSYISQVAQNLVFEQNTASTRNSFLSQVNPYLESVQQRQGLYAFKVIMDDSNNTADVIDRNQMIGQIYIQPTKTAEFIYLDFNILPTGATFPA